MSPTYHNRWGKSKIYNKKAKEPIRLNKGELISLITQIQATISLTTTMESFSFFPYNWGYSGQLMRTSSNSQKKFMPRLKNSQVITFIRSNSIKRTLVSCVRNKFTNRQRLTLETRRYFIHDMLMCLRNI